MEITTTSLNEVSVPDESTLCPQCLRQALVARHCKLLCRACGYVESCEDSFPSSPKK